MSFDPCGYIDAAAAAVDLVIPAEARDAVAANLARLHGLAQQVMTFNLDRAANGEPQRND